MKQLFLLPLFAVQNIVAACVGVKAPRVTVNLSDWNLSRLLALHVAPPLAQVVGVWSPALGLRTDVPHAATIENTVRALLARPDTDPAGFAVVECFGEFSHRFYALPLAACRPLLAAPTAAAGGRALGQHRWLQAAA